MPMTAKKKVGIVCSWLAALVGVLGIIGVIFADASALSRLTASVTAVVQVLIGDLPDSVRAVLEWLSATVIVCVCAAIAAGMSWWALRLHGKAYRGAMLPVLLGVAVMAGAALCVPAPTAVLPAIGVAAGGAGCLLCILLYGWLRQTCPKVFNRETVSYVVFGVLTTVVSFVSHMIFVSFGWWVIYCTVGSWICAVIFAYVVNKLFVFESRTTTPAAFLRELGLFFAARLFSLGVEVAFMWVAVDLLHFANAPCKIIVQVLILVLNYIFSKLIIFKKQTK